MEATVVRPDVVQLGLKGAKEQGGKLSRHELARSLAQFVRPNSLAGTTLVIIDWLLYSVALVGIFFFSSTWAKVFCSIFAGLKLSQFLVLGHDAAHGSLVKSSFGNKFLAVACFLPILYNYRLWIFDHHVLHHPHANEHHPDTYTPLSKAQFDSLSWGRRCLIRFYRAPNVIGFGVYYLVERWWMAKLFPRSFLPKACRPSAWKHFALVITYFAAFTSTLAVASLSSGMQPVSGIFLGLVLPYFVFMTLVGFTLYAQHTHPNIPWFRVSPDRGHVPEELLSVTLLVPSWLSMLMHHPYYHTVHHLNPRIPCYRYPMAHRRLNQVLGSRQVAVKMDLAWFVSTLSRCKLYDFENHRWIDYTGRPTTSGIPWALEADASKAGRVRHS